MKGRKYYRFYTVVDLAVLLGVSISKVRKEIVEKRLKSYVFGNIPLVEELDLERYLREHYSKERKDESNKKEDV